MSCRCGELTKAWKCFSSAFLAKGSLVNSSRPQPTDVQYVMTRYRGFHLNYVKSMEFSNLPVCSLINPDGELSPMCTQGMLQPLKRRSKRGLVHIRRLRIWVCVSVYFETPVAVGVVLPVALVVPAAKVAYLPPCIRRLCMNVSVGVIYTATLRVLTSRDDG
jgi:hypothetical protein